MSKKRLGELLVEAGFISREKLNRALKIQENSGEKLGQVLISLGLISTDILIEFLSKQYGVQGIDLGKELIDENVIGLIPEHIAKKHKVIPVKFKSKGKLKKLVVAMVNPSDFGAIDNITFMSGYSIEPVFIREESFAWFMNYCYHKKGALK
jgi:type IV pilus assembly protein PilB